MAEQSVHIRTRDGRERWMLRVCQLKRVVYQSCDTCIQCDNCIWLGLIRITTISWLLFSTAKCNKNESTKVLCFLYFISFLQYPPPLNRSLSWGESERVRYRTLSSSVAKRHFDAESRRKSKPFCNKTRLCLNSKRNQSVWVNIGRAAVVIWRDNTSC